MYNCAKYLKDGTLVPKCEHFNENWSTCPNTWCKLGHGNACLKCSAKKFGKPDPGDCEHFKEKNK